MFARALREQRTITSADLAWLNDTTPGQNTWSGMNVTPASSLQLLTVYGCVKLITDAISTLPTDCYRKVGTEMQPVTPPRWITTPTAHLTFMPWCSQVLTSLLLHGNSYTAVLRVDGAILDLEPLDPAKVSVRRENGRKVFYVSGSPSMFDIMHIQGMMLPGADVGVSPVEYARQTIGLGLSSAEYGSKFFDRDGNMPGVIEIPGEMQPAKKKELAQMWRRNRSRSGRGLPGVLDKGAVWKQTSVTPEQSQFLGTRQFTAAEIAGSMFNLDPRELGISIQGGLDYTTIDSRNVLLIQRALLPWIARIENALSSLMLAPRYFKFNLEGLKRGDMNARWQSYEIASRINTAAIAAGMDPVMLTSEMRGFEDWNPIEDWTPPAAAAKPTEAPNV